MVALLAFLLRLLVSPFSSISRLEAENAALRRQLIVLQRQVRGRIQFTNSDRLFFLQLTARVECGSIWLRWRSGIEVRIPTAIS